jgi:hypothetical protein
VERPIADEWLGIRTPTVKGRGFCVRGLNSVRVAERVDANIGILRRERDIAARTGYCGELCRYILNARVSLQVNTKLGRAASIKEQVFEGARGKCCEAAWVRSQPARRARAGCAGVHAVMPMGSRSSLRDDRHAPAPALCARGLAMRSRSILRVGRNAPVRFARVRWRSKAPGFSR